MYDTEFLRNFQNGFLHQFFVDKLESSGTFIICLIQNHFQGDGTFAKKDIPDKTMITQYGGLRLLNGTSVDKKFKGRTSTL